ncbi:HNH endonuclease [Limosilactobacillus sp.]|uniref:HNH endonuclease n=1 Tax=Limosilactobacillus sp. TaxID=2773925 RepID=UPI00345EBFF0
MMKLCKEPGCNKPIPMDTDYCQIHAEMHKRQARQPYYNEAQRQQQTREKHLTNKQIYHKRMYASDESQAQQFYKTTAWKHMSRLFLENNPVCIECLKHGIVRKADVADHIVPIRKDWSKRLDMNNLQPLCAKHHWQKTQKEIKERQQARQHQKYF